MKTTNRKEEGRGKREEGRGMNGAWL